MRIKASREEMWAVRYAIRGWLPGQAQMVLDQAEKTITTDPDWAEEDDFAGQCEQLALAARVMADIGQALAEPPGGRTATGR